MYPLNVACPANTSFSHIEQLRVSINDGSDKEVFNPRQQELLILKAKEVAMTNRPICPKSGKQKFFEYITFENDFVVPNSGKPSYDIVAVISYKCCDGQLPH